MHSCDVTLQVPDYSELIATPMDLGTIKEKLKTLQYPDVDSFVSDVRLVFTNSDKYNLVRLSRDLIDEEFNNKL